MRYKTAGRRLVCDIMERNAHRQFTVEELYAALVAEGASVGKSSLYRLTEALCDEGILRKFKETEQSAATFQYIGTDAECGKHLHLKCDVCGKLIHLECAMSRELVSHILADHGFRIDSKKSVLFGKCATCSKEAQIH